jgi:hypothetical protein
MIGPIKGAIVETTFSDINEALCLRSHIQPARLLRIIIVKTKSGKNGSVRSESDML